MALSGNKCLSVSLSLRCAAAAVAIEAGSHQERRHGLRLESVAEAKTVAASITDEILFPFSYSLLLYLSLSLSLSCLEVRITSRSIAPKQDSLMQSDRCEGKERRGREASRSPAKRAGDCMQKEAKKIMPANAREGE